MKYQIIMSLLHEWHYLELNRAEESARSSMNVLGSEQSALRASEMEHSEDLVV